MRWFASWSRKKNSTGSAVASHQFLVDVDTVLLQLGVVGPRVCRLERDSRHAPGLVVALGRCQRDRGPAARRCDFDPALALAEGDVRDD
jgi:hypothetical protein